VSWSEEPSGAWASPDRALLVLRRAEVAVIAAVMAAAGGLGSAAAAAGGLLTGAILGGAFVVWLFADWVVRRRYRAWGYLERDDDLLVRRGVLIRRLSVVPYGRMQFVDVTAGPIERTFKIATVRLHTAAAASDARIPGLAAPEAARLRDTLAARGEAHAAGL
jgi:membrane protein YdbS with pleckstrin-like domain